MTEPLTLLHQIAGLDPATVTLQLLTPFATLGGAVVTCRTFYTGVRWLRADAETRLSLEQSRRIRRTWRLLAPQVGLAVTEPARPGRDGRPGEPKVRLPRIKVNADEFGVTVTATTLPTIGREAWRDAADDLRNAWGMQRMKISQPKPGSVVVRGFRREPLDTPLPSPLVRDDGAPAVEPGSLSCRDDVLLGQDEDGHPVRLNLAAGAHGLIAGVTRSGKSVTVNTLLAHASLMRDVRLMVIDPNLAAAAPWWITAHRVSDTTHPDQASELLAEIREEMHRRENLFWTARTDKITEFSPELPLLVVVIDEVAHYTRHTDRKARERFEAHLLAIASQGAKYGVRLWLITQKPSAEVLTTALRTNLSTRICHRVDTTEDYLHLFPDGRDLDITAADRTLPPGVAITSTPGTPTPVRMRAVHLPTEACWRINDTLTTTGHQVRPLPGTTDFTKAA